MTVNRVLGVMPTPGVTAEAIRRDNSKRRKQKTSALSITRQRRGIDRTMRPKRPVNRCGSACRGTA
jgi:hypothetical protein